MIKPILIATMVLVAAAMSALAQVGAPQGAQHPTVIGQTGTMYDGNNANLQLPPEQNAYWARLWAEPGATGQFRPRLGGRRRDRRQRPRWCSNRRSALITVKRIIALVLLSPGLAHGQPVEVPTLSLDGARSVLHAAEQKAEQLTAPSSLPS